VSALFHFEDRRAFGKVDLLKADGGTDMEIPADLLDRPEVLIALLIISSNGGKGAFNRLSDSEVLEVDQAARTVAPREFEL